MTIAERITAPIERGIDQLCIDALRVLAIDAVERAGSGHPGAPMGMAPMAHILWDRFLKHDPAAPEWFDRDRFILSAGHASTLLYGLLHLSGYGVTLADLRAFRSWGSITPGHPELGLTPGVETTTGPLGQGFATGVGMAIAERYLARRFNRPGFPLIDHHVYALVSDGDLMEGVSAEAASLAGHLRLGKLVYLYDSNGISIDGPTSLAFTESVSMRFRAYGWDVQHVSDGNDLESLEAALTRARGVERPSLVVVATRIGFGAPTKEGSAAAHGAPLGPEEARGAKRNLGWNEDEEFHVPEQVRLHFERATARGARARRDWEAMLQVYRRAHRAEAEEIERLMAGELPEGFDSGLPSFSAGERVATRKASGIALNALAGRVPELIGGSADLTGSVNTWIEGAGVFDAEEGGRNLHFGVREHAMGAALNGMALHGLRPFGGTFLVFSDYMRPAVRLAALMRIPVVFVFTHDSIGLGEDGPTHQPVEHLASLRAMPGLVVIRPADANETVGAWRVALEHRGPVALALTRQDVPVLPSPSGRPPVERGAYVLHDPPGDPAAVLLATGSEVHVALAAAELSGLAVRVVSMPSWELFESQPEEYRDGVLPPGIARLAVEAAAGIGWHRWVGDTGGVVSLDRFGASAPGRTVLECLGFSARSVAARLDELLRGPS